ncbi:MAG: hypothetical protein ACRDBP_08205 [Luteolibacter sp.]
MMSPPATPRWNAREPTFRSVVGITVARRVAIIGLLALSPTTVEAITVTATFDDLSESNNANNGIGNLYQSGDFNFAAGNLFFRGTRHVYYSGSGALFTAASQPMTITRDGGLAFNFYAADVAERENAAGTAGFSGIRADGSRVSASVRLDGGNSSSQNFGFAGFTNLVSLQFTGGDQLDRIVFSDLTPPPASDATVHFDNANIGTVGASYSENGYQLSSSAPGGMGIQSTMNDSHGLGVAGTATIDLTHAGGLFNLQGFAIHSQLGEFGQFRLIVTDEAGALHTSSTFSLGTYDDTALLQLFGGQAFANQITSARFENTTGQGIVLDNIYAVPEPSSLLLVVSAVVLALRRNGPRNSFRP